MSVRSARQLIAVIEPGHGAVVELVKYQGP
jgi:hypothetical protein